MISMETLLLMTFPSLTVSHMKVNDYTITEKVTIIEQRWSLILWFLLLICVLPSFVKGELPANTTITAVTTPAPTDRPHSCPDGEFVCGESGECVPTCKVCDFRHDCSDGSDEINCGKMLFSCLWIFLYSYPPLSIWCLFSVFLWFLFL